MRAFNLIVAALLIVVPLHAQVSELPGTLAPQRITPTVRVVRELGPAVVNVYQEVVQEVELPAPWNRVLGPRRSRHTTLGSGFIIDADGYILTNAHVIQGGDRGIKVRLSDGSTYLAELINLDTDNDVALLRIRPDVGVQLRAARLGTSSDLMVGESVIAFGNPLGNENSVSTGIISSLLRDVRLPNPSSSAQVSPAHEDFIQTDAPINPGNSGGPLINVLGEVIGINSAVAAGGEGIGFAIPIDRVRRSLMQVLANPLLHREVVTGLKIEGDSTGHNVHVTQVIEDGPGAAAGLQRGDLLVEVRDEPIDWEFDYNKALLDTRPGDVIPIVVQRGSRTIRTTLQLERDESPLLFIWRRLGLTVMDHPRYKGVRVERVDPAGPGAELGIQVGDLIDGIDEIQIDSSVDLYHGLQQLASGTRIVVHVWRGRSASSGELTLN
jgi:S1-C subfamily serine protease